MIREDQLNEVMQKFHNEAFVEPNGVVRWKNNMAVPPSDLLTLWASNDCVFNLQQSLITRKLESLVHLSLCSKTPREQLAAFEQAHLLAFNTHHRQ